MSDDKKNESPFNAPKAMAAHRNADAWKDHEKKLAQQKAAGGGMKKPAPLMKRNPSDYDPIAHTDTSPSGLKLANEMGVGAIAGFQIPQSIKQRKEKVDELLGKHADIGEGVALAYLSSLSDDDAEGVCSSLDNGDLDSVAGNMRTHAVRQLVQQKVKEVVRKKAGGGGYTLYAPNPGKKGKSKPVGNFPTKLGAKRAELARYPPKNPAKLSRLRKEVDRLQKNPKKAAEREKAASKQKGTDDYVKKNAHPKKESLQLESPGQLHSDLNAFMGGLKGIPKDSPERGKYITAHMGHAPFLSNLQKHPQGKQIHQQLMGFLNSKANAGPAGAKKLSVQGQSTSTPFAKSESVNESTTRRVDFYNRGILSKIVFNSLTESLFREEKTESEWDEYISKLSKQALSGDNKLQNLQKSISRKTEEMLSHAFDSIRKEVGKTVKLKNFGIKKDSQTGETYLAFSASLSDVTAEPLYIRIVDGVPKIELSDNAKVALTKTDPDDMKLFRAELVTVQERVLDSMDDLSKAVQARDKYLDKLEMNVDSYIAGLSPLEVSLLKKLLVKKYKKI